MADEKIIQRNILALRMERQHLIKPAEEEEYIGLYRDMQPGNSAYWHGFGQPPVISCRAAFDDMEYNRERQRTRKLLKGRFQGGNLGWIMAEELELFACLYCRPMTKFTYVQEQVWQIVGQMGPVTIHQIKEETGLLVKEITPALHRLQEAFLVYEDQYDGDWERGWYRFDDMFPEVDLHKYTKQEACCIVIKRYAYRMVYFTAEMAKNFLKTSVKDTKACIDKLVSENILCSHGDGYVRKEDENLLSQGMREIPERLLLMHRNDILVKSVEPALKKRYVTPGFETLYYIFVEGDFHGAVNGKYTYSTDVVQEVLVDKGYGKYLEEIKQKIHEMPSCRESVIQKITVMEE